jgi:hypothetical protein
MRNMSPTVRLAMGTVRKCLPQDDSGGIISSMWSLDPKWVRGINVRLFPETTAIGLVEETYTPVTSSVDWSWNVWNAWRTTE